MNAPGFYDVFNGDADGICSLHQYRLAFPCQEAQLITGVKRDIQLLSKLHAVQNSTITVFDISLDSNRDSLVHLLDQGNSVRYYDHHFAGEIPDHPQLSHTIIPSAKTCASLIVNTALEEKHAGWAVCGAYGDNLHESAMKLAKKTGFSEENTLKLREIGELLNYNGYGAHIDDLHIHPASLYKEVAEYTDPLRFYAENSMLQMLQDGFSSDMKNALSATPFREFGANRIYRLPQAAWARRISGVFANLKAREQRDGAHVLLTGNNDGTLRISVRAPIDTPENADTLCKMFPTGGGRAGAAGINSLPEKHLKNFFTAFARIYE